MNKSKKIIVKSFSDFKSELEKITNTYTIDDFFLCNNISGDIYRPIEVKGQFKGYKFEGNLEELFSCGSEYYFVDINDFLEVFEIFDISETISLDDFISMMEEEEYFENCFQCEDINFSKLIWEKNTPDEIISDFGFETDNYDQYFDEQYDGDIVENIEYENIEVFLSCKDENKKDNIEFIIIWRKYQEF